jgi:phage gp36-like protein
MNFDQAVGADLDALGPESPAAAEGRYATQTDVENKFGRSNVAIWSDLDNDGTADVARIQEALDHADADIDGFMRDGPYTVPLVLGTSGQHVVHDWAATLAGAWLYNSRGIRADDPIETKIARMVEATYEDMRLYKGLIRHLDASYRWPAPTGPVGI